MGWLFYNSQYFKSNGQVDRIREIESGFSEKYSAIKSTMVGSTYYAAIKNHATGEIFGYVVLTSSDKKQGYNFGYKSMDEFCGPTESKCPMSIIKLLTPTEHEWANAWRERCREYHRQKKSTSSFANLPVGTKAIWTIPHEHFTHGNKGDKVEIEKYHPIGRRACWVCWSGNYRINPKYVNQNDLVIVGQ